MKSQNLKNHRRFDPMYHYFMLPGSLVLFIGTIVNMFKASSENMYDASLVSFGSLLLMLLILFARGFALKAQDRAIIAEEKMRHYILTGKALNTKLKPRQIIGLRFASDDEFSELANKAAEEGLSEKAIKKSIKNWRADNYRV